MGKKQVKFEGHKEEENGITVDQDLRATVTDLSDEEVKIQAERQKDLAASRAAAQAHEDALNGTTPGGASDASDADSDDDSDDDSGEDEEPVLTGHAADTAMQQAVPEGELTKAQLLDRAHGHLDALRAHFGNRKEDEIIKTEKLNRVDLDLVMEHAARKAKGKPVHLSDGNIERLRTLHARISPRFK